MKKKIILITGASGYIGSVLVKKLLEKNYYVVTYGNHQFGENILKSFQNIEKLSIMKGNLLDEKKLRKALKNVSVVIHLAGIVGDPASELDKSYTNKINIES